MKSIKNPGVHYQNIFVKQFHTKATEISCTQTVTVLFDPVQSVITVENIFHWCGKIMFQKYRYFRGTLSEAEKFGKSLNWS